MKRHKHAEIIHAWAEGETIQIQDAVSILWRDETDPIWCADRNYRIKPKIIKKAGWINVCSYEGFMRYTGGHIFPTEGSALLNKPTTWVSTIKIEWEETE